MKKGSHHKPESKEKNRNSHLGRPCPETTKEVNRARFLTDNPMKKDKNRTRASKRMKENNPMFDPASRASMIAKKTGATLSDDHIEKIKIGTKEALADPDVRKRMSESHEDIPRPQWVRDKIGKGNEGKVRSEEARNKIRNSREGKYCGENAGFYGKTHSEESIQKMREVAILINNDIWYGGVKYPEDTRGVYCEKWNENLRERIRAFWGYKSAISGKGSEENNGRALDCHHVYFQKKACCQWDENVQGYYAWINNEKYYIRGDPNKFVPVTRDEHTKMLNDKIYWIKFFEDLIEKNGGKSYFTKEEMKTFKENFNSKLI